jgi:hypothetical protein
MLHDGNILNMWGHEVLLKGEACLLENWQGVHVCSESDNWFPLPNDAYDSRLTKDTFSPVLDLYLVKGTPDELAGLDFLIHKFRDLMKCPSSLHQPWLPFGGIFFELRNL